LRLRLAEHYCREHKDVCIVILPAARPHPCFGAGFFQEPLAIPSLFNRDLWEQKAFVHTILHE
jgi:hypothetical protein